MTANKRLFIAYTHACMHASTHAHTHTHTHTHTRITNKNHWFLLFSWNWLYFFSIQASSWVLCLAAHTDILCFSMELSLVCTQYQNLFHVFLNQEYNTLGDFTAFFISFKLTLVPDAVYPSPLYAKNVPLKILLSILQFLEIKHALETYIVFFGPYITWFLYFLTFFIFTWYFSMSHISSFILSAFMVFELNISECKWSLRRIRWEEPQRLMAKRL